MTNQKTESVSYKTMNNIVSALLNKYKYIDPDTRNLIAFYIDEEIQQLKNDLECKSKAYDNLYEWCTKETEASHNKIEILEKLVEAAKTNINSIIKDFELVKFKAHERSDKQTEFISATVIRNLCDLLEVLGGGESAQNSEETTK